MLLQELYDKVKPKTQDLDAFVYFDQEGLIYEPNNKTRLFVRDGAVRTPGITKVSDLSAQLAVTSVPQESVYAHYDFNDLPETFITGEVQESFVQTLNALSSYGNTLFYKGYINCKSNEIRIYCSGLQYIMIHKSQCKMPDFSIAISPRSWNIIYFLHQMIKENKVKKASYYTVNIIKSLYYLWVNTEEIYGRFNLDNWNNDELFNIFTDVKTTSKYIGKFDRKYVNDVERNVKLKHLLKAFIDQIEIYKYDGRLSIYQDNFTKLYFI